MAQPVVIKGGKNYFTLVFDPEPDFPLLLDRTVEKLREAENFFRGHSLCVRFTGRSLSEEEKGQLLDAVTRYTEINICCLVEEDEAAEFTAAYKCFKELHPEEFLDSKGLPRKTEYSLNAFLRQGDLEAGEELYCPGSLIIYGNVPENAFVSAGDCITVFGGLYGTAKAGQDPSFAAPFIRADDFKPQSYMIGSLQGSLPLPRKLLFKSEKKLARKASIGLNSDQQPAITLQCTQKFGLFS